MIRNLLLAAHVVVACFCVGLAYGARDTHASALVLDTLTGLAAGVSLTALVHFACWFKPRFDAAIPTPRAFWP